MIEILRRLRDEPNWNPSFGPGGLSRQEAKVWHETCLLAADEIERLSTESSKMREFILDGYCPNTVGFEGPRTFPDCGKCLYCELTAAVEQGQADE